MSSPEVQQKLALAATAAKGKSKGIVASAAGALQSRGGIAVPLATQANSQFLTVDADGSSSSVVVGTGPSRVEVAHPGSAPEGVPSTSRETHAAYAQTETVVYLPMTLIPDKEDRLETCGRDMIRLLRMYSHAHP